MIAAFLELAFSARFALATVAVCVLAIALIVAEWRVRWRERGTPRPFDRRRFW